MPVVKSLTILLLLALTRGLGLPEHPPLAEVAGPPSVRLVALVVGGQGVAGQTAALSLQRVHAPHEARGPGLASSAVGRVTRARGAQLIARAVSWVIYKPLLQQGTNKKPWCRPETDLALALRGQGRVVEGEDVADGTRTPGVELVTLQPEIKPDAGNFQIYVLHVTLIPSGLFICSWFVSL